VIVMSDQRQEQRRQLELNRETIRELTESEAERVRGGGAGTVLTVSWDCPPTGDKYAGGSPTPTDWYVRQTAVCATVRG
jgi:hypothetical protein